MPTTLKHIGKTAVAGALARLFTIVIPLVAVRIYGFGSDTDSFFLAAAVILFWTTSVAPVLETGIATHFVGDPGVADWSVIVNVGTRFTALALGLGLAATAALTLAPETFVDPSLAARTRQILLELSPLLVFTIWSSLLNGWLNARERFGTAALSPALVGVTALASMYGLAPYLGIHALVIGYLVGETLRLAYLAAVVWWTRPKADPAAAQAPESTGPAFDAMSLQWLCLVMLALNPVVDRFLAGGLDVGSISVFELIERLTLVPAGIMTWAVLPVVTTRLARHAHSPDAFESRLRQVLAVAFVGGVALAVLLALVHRWLLPALFASARSGWPEYGNAAFLCLIAGLPFQLCTLVLWRAAAILGQRGRVFIIVGVAGFAANLAGDLVAMRIWGLAGIAVGTTLAYLLTSVLWWNLARPAPPDRGR